MINAIYIVIGILSVCYYIKDFNNYNPTNKNIKYLYEYLSHSLIFNSNSFYSFSQSIRKTNDKYLEIYKKDYFSELAGNRVEYVFSLIKSAVNNNLVNTRDYEFIKELETMLKTTEEFLNQILVDIKTSEDKVSNEVKNYLKYKMKEYTTVTSEMEKDFRSMNSK